MVHAVPRETKADTVNRVVCADGAASLYEGDDGITTAGRTKDL